MHVLHARMYVRACMRMRTRRSRSACPTSYFLLPTSYFLLPTYTQVEKCLSRLRETREKIERTLELEEGLPPPREPLPITSYHVQVKTAAAHIYIYIYIYMYTCIHIHTHIHIQVKTAAAAPAMSAGLGALIRLQFRKPQFRKPRGTPTDLTSYFLPPTYYLLPTTGALIRLQFRKPRGTPTNQYTADGGGFDEHGQQYEHGQSYVQYTQEMALDARNLLTTQVVR